MSDKPLVSFDYAIKYLLKDKADYEIVEGFVSALLKAHGYGAVKIIGLLDTESNKEDKFGKRSLADLIVEDTDHHKYIVEIERNYKHTFVHKACFNTSRLIVDHLAQNIDYDEIKVFHITLLYFSVGEGVMFHGKMVIEDIETKNKKHFCIQDPKTSSPFNAIDILPEYFFISIPAFDDRLEQEIHEWLYVMKHDAIPENFHSPYMKKVAEKLSILKMTPEERDAYYAYRKKLCDERNELEAAEAKGKAEGKAEERAVLIKLMRQNGCTVDEIARITNFSLDEINNYLM